MHTLTYKEKIHYIISNLVGVVSMVVSLMNRRKDNKGSQFKINVNPNREGTIALRCNHILITSVSYYIEQVIHHLSLSYTLPLLELISINSTSVMDKTTQRKRVVYEKRTIYITLRPPREVYNHLLQELPAAKENYMRTTELLNVLEKTLCNSETVSKQPGNT